MSEILNIGDPIFYQGTRHQSELTRDGKPLKGWIHAQVLNQPDCFCVEFPDAKADNQDYIMHASHLRKARPTKTEKHDGPEIAPRRVRVAPEEK